MLHTLHRTQRPTVNPLTPCSTPATPRGTFTPFTPFKPFTPCNPFAPCSTNRCASTNVIPSTAAAITTPAKLDRDSRNSNVSKPPPPPPNSPANPGNPNATHTPTGSRRNSARNTGSTNNRSIKRPANTFSSSHRPVPELLVEPTLQPLRVQHVRTSCQIIGRRAADLLHAAAAAPGAVPASGLVELAVDLMITWPFWPESARS